MNIRSVVSDTCVWCVAIVVAALSLIDGHLDGNPRQQLIKQDNPHRPSFGVAFVLWRTH